MVKAIVPRGAKTVAEVGVALGDFSSFLIDVIRPEEFVAFDTFQMHEWPSHWGRSSNEIFGEKTHKEFYHERFSRSKARIVIEEGMSYSTLPKYPESSFDFIYLDAAHTYREVKIDTELCSRLLTESGILIFNDYTMFDPHLEAHYGVVQAVNELVVSGDWVVVGFALHCDMFCDIAIKRKKPSSLLKRILGLSA